MPSTSLMCFLGSPCFGLPSPAASPYYPPPPPPPPGGHARHPTPAGMPGYEGASSKHHGRCPCRVISVKDGRLELLYPPSATMEGPSLARGAPATVLLGCACQATRALLPDIPAAERPPPPPRPLFNHCICLSYGRLPTRRPMTRPSSWQDEDAYGLANTLLGLVYLCSRLTKDSRTTSALLP